MSARARSALRLPRGRDAARGRHERDDAGEIVILSYDEKPGIQAIGNTTPDLPPVPGTHPTTQRDHEYKRHGTVTLMAGIDLPAAPGPSCHLLAARPIGSFGPP
jgi:hypothetical protein